MSDNYQDSDCNLNEKAEQKNGDEKSFNLANKYNYSLINNKNNTRSNASNTNNTSFMKNDKNAHQDLIYEIPNQTNHSSCDIECSNYYNNYDTNYEQEGYESQNELIKQDDENDSMAERIPILIGQDFPEKRADYNINNKDIKKVERSNKTYNIKGVEENKYNECFNFNFESFQKMLENLKTKLISQIEFKSDNKLKIVFKFISQSYDFLKMFEQKLNNERILLEKYSLYSIKNEENIIYNELKNNTSSNII